MPARKRNAATSVASPPNKSLSSSDAGPSAPHTGTSTSASPVSTPSVPAHVLTNRARSKKVSPKTKRTGMYDREDQRQNPATGPLKSSQWLVLAIGSGAFAATNGVFAKLTTANKTEAIAVAISRLSSFDSLQTVEWILRACFLGLNVLSNMIMWYLFTQALTAGTSTVRVTILNTSANFAVTAILGMVVFGEHLPLGWWAGAALLMMGSVIIGTRESKEQAQAPSDSGSSFSSEDAGTHSPSAGQAGVESEDRYKDEPDDPL